MSTRKNEERAFWRARILGEVCTQPGTGYAYEATAPRVKPGDTVYILRHRAASGMSRVIDLFVINDGEPSMLGFWVAGALGLPYDRKREGIKVNGTGMDMGFHVVYELARVLWPDGYGCVGEGCRSNAHTNGDRDYTPHGVLGSAADWPACDACCTGDRSAANLYCPAHSHWHLDSGYALRHAWL